MLSIPTVGQLPLTGRPALGAVLSALVGASLSLASLGGPAEAGGRSIVMRCKRGGSLPWCPPGKRTKTLCPQPGTCLSTSVHPRMPNQPTSRVSSGVPEGSCGVAKARFPSAYPVLSLQLPLTTALSPRLAPGCGASCGRVGWPVLLGQLWSRLLTGVLKRMLHAVHVQPSTSGV